ncbi:hypothetical protein KPH14_012807 [Odynerus spinipes]|uniref:Gag protein n=1 Tax=Odynerus spinipes TaxID=1348599 RepID=A0AAD9VLB4_9HYME|nr:hypothetical protein KPH14_012807 [Odynerus spinipes]
MSKETRSKTRKNPTVLDVTEISAADMAVNMIDNTIDTVSRVMRTSPDSNKRNTREEGARANIVEEACGYGHDSNNAYERLLRVVEDLQSEVTRQNKQIRDLEIQLSARIETRVEEACEEFLDKFIEHKREMRDLTRGFEVRLENDRHESTKRDEDFRRQIYHQIAQIENVRRHEEVPNDPYHLTRQQRLPPRISREEWIEQREASLSRNAQTLSVERPGVDCVTREDSSPILGTRPFIVKPQLPSFEGKSSDKPPKFIRELKRFVDAARVPDNELKFIITQALKGVASEWWDLVADHIDTWSQFTTAFLNRFWSVAIQRKVRENLDTGAYRPETGISRVSYAMKLIGSARDLVPRRTDEEIVLTIARHFSQAVDDCVVGQNIATVDGLLAILERFDNGGTVNRPRFNERHISPNGNNWRGPQDSQNHTSAYVSRPPGTVNNSYITRQPVDNRRSNDHFVGASGRDDQKKQQVPARIRTTHVETSEEIQTTNMEDCEEYRGNGERGDQ